ncbi:hypothetical protein NEUTE1DRAFT_102028 [Neurospora tetrasperma FGSC 2508]|uniref:Uncharacterized protein n=1 Tax=Neurospora tetrasperma (strain FGSC 2508 / ATCC MYA-4615 / P0657) TaxID=510951 RepID=F8MQX8_NEUT8|nr:uncharacterized protein NEUTE1DRAFT_102028 [Neurospora tetrasperma FGSC 2508]EGO56758.1 hypothetical protein NEUTE1DRAFT_102028 [Neurospora tetrasperma FGSC 2508]
MYQAAVRSLSRCCHKGACLSRATENDGSACNDGNRSVSVPEQMADGYGTGRRAMVYPTATMYEDGRYRERGPEFGWCCAGKPSWTSCRCRNVSRRKSRVGSRRLELPPCWVRVVRDWQECPGTAVEKRG